ncbi:hypothetical protein AA313_de0208704 [Arthrobotrys entomopaga]|nr:hypothetical protein AA313_de0208704 [Arthrobotrys entomopaga]
MPCTVTAFPFFDLYEESILCVLPFQGQVSEEWWRARFKEMVNEEYAILRIEQIYRLEETESERRGSFDSERASSSGSESEPESVIQRLRNLQTGSEQRLEERGKLQ